MASADDIGVRMVCLGDKLSNIRAIQRDHERLGDGLWARFNQKDLAEHAWYYSTVADVLEGDLGDTDAWREYEKRVGEVFGGGVPAFAYLLATNGLPIDEECVVLRRAGHRPPALLLRGRRLGGRLGRVVESRPERQQPRGHLQNRGVRHHPEVRRPS